MYLYLSLTICNFIDKIKLEENINDTLDDTLPNMIPIKAHKKVI